MIPISRVVVDPETEALVLSVLRSGQLAQGPMVARFEASCAAMAGTAHAVAVNNGTTALEIALQALGVGPGDEVVTTPFTFAATVNAILHSGATVRFADVTEDYTIDPDGMQAAMTDRTAAVMPVHLYGLPADMVRIDEICRAREVAIVEDAAQAHGATVGGRPVGGYGVAAFSFYATKNISTGEGGVVTTDDAELADRMRVLRNQGMRARYEYVVPGHNYRMTDLTAALAVTQFEHRAEMEARRRANAETLSEGLADLDWLVLPSEPAGRTSVWHQYTVRVRDGGPVTRDDLMRHLGERGVGCGVYYPHAAYDYDCYRSHPQVVVSPCPNAERFAASVLSLPVHQHLGGSDLDTIIGAVRSAPRR